LGGLGAHWLADVLGGYALAAAWLATIATATNTIAQLRGGQPGEARFTHYYYHRSRHIYYDDSSVRGRALWTACGSTR
jgi:membrane-associated phospholipid phosphatase